METKKQKIVEIASKGNWFYFHGENRCEHCGEYQFEGKHTDKCPFGALLQLIEDGVPE